MAEINEPTGNPIDLRRAQIMDAEVQVDASALGLAAVFGTVSFPPGTPEYLKEAILDRAQLVRNADGAFLIDQRMKSDGDRRHGRDADDDDNMSQWAEAVRQEQQEREREEWSRTKSTVAGVTMTGAEWARLAERIRSDEDFRRTLIEAFERRGATRSEAEERADHVRRIAEAASIPKGQRTEQQERDLADAPNAQADLQIAATLTSENTSPRHSAESLSGRFDTAVTAAKSPEPSPSQTEPSRPVVTIASGPGF